MRRLLLGLWLLVLWLPACRFIAPDLGTTSIPTQTPTAELDFASPPSAEVGVPRLPEQDALTSEDFTVRLHPDGGLYPGDLVSFEVIAPASHDMKGRTAQIVIDAPEDVVLEPQEFGRFGIGGRTQATFEWAWDTGGLPTGEYAATISILPGGPTWTETITLQPGSPQTGRWAMAESECCMLYYISGTAAERDLFSLRDMANSQAEAASQQMGVDFNRAVGIVFLPRVLGHGGFANEEISISYLDRNYAGGSPEIVLHHEMIHILDRELGGEFRPSLFVEGLAVYMSGGHFKPEPLAQRAAALLELGWYLPLAPLADRFYLSQHEIGYLEAGALVEYMITRWGRADFERFYRQMRPIEGSPSQAEAINAALLEHFQMTLAELENDFLRYLKQQPLDPFWVEDVRLTVRFYETVRRYQQALDPSAYYLAAWLPEGEQMRQRGIVADYLRTPSAPENIAIETLLVAADKQLESGDLSGAERLLQIINAALDVVESRALK